MPTASVKWFDSTMTGAPTLTGQSGSLVNLLDAVLVNGFNLKSVGVATVASNVCTLDFGTAHGFTGYQIVEIAGATPSGLNGEQRVLAVTANTLTFATSGISDQTATGSITCKTAPLGWTKRYTGTNKAVYQRPDVDATAMLLRVDDTGSGSAKYANVRMYEAMTDVDNGSANVVSMSWFKSNSADATVRPWRLYGDGKRVFFLPQWTSSGVGDPYLWGDLVSYKAGDAYHCLLGGTRNTSAAGVGQYNSTLEQLSTSLAACPMIMRAYTQIGSAINSRCEAAVSGKDAFPLGYLYSGFSIPYPNPVDGALILRGQVEFTENSAPPTGLRGRMPGLYPTTQGVPLADGDTVENITGLPGRRLRAQAIGAYASYTVVVGRVFIDLTGPWD